MQINNNPDVGLEELQQIDVNQQASGINRKTIQEKPKMLNAIIKEFLSSEEYKEMLDVDKYYESKNTNIINRSKQMMLYDEKEKIINGKTVKETYPYIVPDLSKANHKLAHSYLYELVNQCKDYLVGNPVKTEYNNKIPKKLSELIDDILYKDNKWGKYNQENVKNAQKYKIGWSRVVIDDEGKLKLLNVNSKQVIYFLDDYDELECLIYLYTKIEYDDKGKKKQIKYAEVFDDTYKDIYKSTRGSQYLLDQKDVPLLQKITKFGDDEQTKQTEILSWERIPWVAWKYNDDNIDVLTPIRCFIDILDIDLSDLANNVDDIQDAIWILENYQGQSISQFMEDLKVKKAINVGEGGKVDNKTTEIPHEARMKLYEKCEKNIYKFGRGIDFADRDNLGNASGVALKWSYGPLDEKADDLEENGQIALNYLFNLLFVYLKVTGQYKNEFDSNDIKFIFDRSMITNEIELVNEVMNSTDLISRKTALSHHPFVEDAEEEMKLIDEDEREFDEEVVDNDVDEESEEDESKAERDERDNRNKNTKKNNKNI